MISIITVALNNLEGLKKTITSTLAQTHSDFELIVVDGDSDDGSKKFLSSIQDARVLASSEPDHGIYHAFNKGVSKTSGSWVIFLNAGDEFASENALETFSEFADVKYKIIYSDLFIEGKSRKQPPIFKWGIFCNPCHQTVLFNKNIFHEFAFDEAYKISADSDLIMRIVQKYGNRACLHIPQPLINFETDGISSRNLKLIHKERAQQIKSNLTNPIHIVLNSLNLKRQKSKSG